jgi:uncharacterized protein
MKAAKLTMPVYSSAPLNGHPHDRIAGLVPCRALSRRSALTTGARLPRPAGTPEVARGRSMTMTAFASDIAFTPAIKAIQERKGSRRVYARQERGDGWPTTITLDLIAMLVDLDMFYLGTANAAGQPYIQYRGGPPGFLKVIDEHTMGFADFGGNRQYITLGNLSENPKAFLFLMDYANRRRMKVWGTARVVEGDADLEEQLGDPAHPGKVERAILFTVEAWDVNCSQHIQPRFSQRQIAPVIGKLQSQIAELENEIEILRSGSSMHLEQHLEQTHAIS